MAWPGFSLSPGLDLGRPFTGIPATMRMLVLGLCLCVIPHALRVPVWISILFFILAGWRLLAHSGRARSLDKIKLLVPLFKLLMGAAIFAGIFLSYGTLLGRDAGVALLILLAGMKLVETGKERDYYIAAFIGLFLVLTNFFYSESILSALYMLLCLTVIFSALISLNDPGRYLNTGRRLGLSSALLLQAAPLMLVLFVLFPRVSGPLWGLPKDAHSGLSGLDDEMSPGMISQLTLSDAVAFRAEFHGAVPEKAALYWRGPVLWFTDGVKWLPDEPRAAQRRARLAGPAFRYTITLEPTDKNWLYGLEHVEAPPARAQLSHDLQIFTRSAVRERIRYTLTSYTQYQLDANSAEELRQALQLPPRYHPRTRALAQSWRSSGMDAAAIVNQALRLFNEEEFYYTLQPPLLLNDSVDQFLFDARAGFCEHYAAAFVVLMRAAGVPARVVTGYQGGTMNPVGNYLIVRQRDAHAWAEVWLAGHGWVRVDPTAAVAPARIIEGIENALPESLIDIPLALQNSAMARDLWRRLRDTLDAVNNRWNQWILAYDKQRQLLFLRHIGLGRPDWPGLLLYLSLTLALIIAGLALWLFRPPATKTDEARALYERFCARLSKLGIIRHGHEGPLDFAGRASLRRADLKLSIEKITRLYIRVRYGDQDQAMPAFRQAVQRFRPARRMTG